ncbi:NmrA family NAD(P)-binding protein [Arthrobacter sp. NPDC093125]|uniref:NmrA family NAD(P)-binding protein n=1 Tax=Arthrobacter sp. NPDC093125 TaxID=3363944 RepID=UPI00382F0901
MADLPDLAVTGSTGVPGGMVARGLAEAGFSQRLLVRDAGRAPQLPDAPAVVAGYADAAGSRSALQGTKTLFATTSTWTSCPC